MATKDDSLYVATESFVTGDGIHYTKDATRITGALVKKNKWEHLFKPVEANYDVPETKAAAKAGVEKATAAPGEKRTKT